MMIDPATPYGRLEGGKAMPEAGSVTEAQLEAACSFVPRLVRAQLAGSARTFDAAVLFVDLVGFTATTASMIAEGPDGLERITELLNRHYHSLHSSVERHGGEAVRYIGDALLALFPAETRPLAEAAQSAISCAGELVDGTLSALAVRALVAAGTVSIDIFGQNSCLFAVTGEPIGELSALMKRAEKGAVEISETVADLVRDKRPRPVTIIPAPPIPPFAALRRFVPPAVSARIDAGDLAWLAELRRVTAVFAAFSPPRSIEEAIGEARLLAELHAAWLHSVVQDDKGWSIILLVGISPFADADDAVRAVRLARALVPILGRQSAGIGVGVATGRAFCGAVGSSRRREYQVIGNVMNLAARLSGVARGTAICDERTARLVGAAVVTKPLPGVPLKGFGDEVAICEIGQDVERRRNGLAGRDPQCRMIAEALAERTAPIIFKGEAGIGKSHLLDEAAAQAQALGFLSLYSIGSEAMRASSYQPWRAIFQALLTRAGSVAALMTGQDAALAPLLSAVLPMAAHDNETTARLAGQQRAQRSIDLLIGILADSAAQTPTLLLFDDLHLFDGPSLDLLAGLLRRRPKGVVVVAAMRLAVPAELPSLIEAGASVEMLEPLSQEQTRAILLASLAVDEIDETLVDHIHERARGNPLFIEELAHALVESGAVRVENGRCTPAAGAGMAAIDIPATVEGTILSRLDRLESAIGLTIKTASVVGTVFSRQIVSSTHPHEHSRPHVDAHLGVLMTAQIVEREADPRWRFRHDLVRDVAYGLLLFAQRRELHQAVASWHEQNYADDLSPYFALLAHHYRHAGEPVRAADYLEQEAIRAFSIGLARQSVTIGIEAAELLGIALPKDPAAAGERIEALIVEVLTALAGRQPAELLSLPTLRKPEIGRAVKLLLELAPFTFQAGRPDLYAVIGLTCLALTLEHGSSAPDVYSTYSVVHRTIHHDPGEAFAWSRLALDHDAKTGSQARARTAFVHGWFHNHWVRPFSTSIADSLEAAEFGLASGDVLFGCYNLSAHVIYLAAAGAPLGDVIRRAQDHLARNGGRVVNAAFHCRHEMQVAKALAGMTDAPLSLSDGEIDEARDLASICDTDYYNQIGYYLVSRVKLHALFGDPEGALDWAGRVAPLVPAIAGQVAEIDLAFYRSLAEIDLGALEPARETMRLVDGWARGCPHNFRALHRILAAASAHAGGDLEGAATGFGRAAAEAQRRGQAHLRAIALERLSRLPGREPARVQAIQAFRDWGAEAKAASLS